MTVTGKAPLTREVPLTGLFSVQQGLQHHRSLQPSVGPKVGESSQTASVHGHVTPRFHTFLHC